MGKVLITLWDGPVRARVGDVRKFVAKNEKMLKKLSKNRNWVKWITDQKKEAEKGQKKIKKGISLSPPTQGSRKRIETGSLIKGKVIVPDDAKGAIKQKDKNLTAYGKESDKEEPNTVLKKAITKDWTIVTDNCFGVAYMKALNKPYESPFFSMYILAPDYIKLLENFDEYMSKTPVGQSPPGKTRFYKGRERKYPVLILKGKEGDIEIHMAHEKQSPKEAIEKWEKRKSRMNMNKKDMFVKMDDRDQFNKKLGMRFLALKQFPHKKLFVSQKWKKDFEGLPNVQITGYKTSGPIGTKLEKEFPIK
jgi:uncharacterized protein (DUF1919 family)